MRAMLEQGGGHGTELAPGAGMLGVVSVVSETIQRWAHLRWQGNELLHWAYALAALILSLICFRAAHFFLCRRFRKLADRSRIGADDVISEIVSSTRWFFHVALALEVARQFIEVPKAAVPILNGTVVVALFVQLGLWVRTAAMSGTRVWVSKQEVKAGHTATVASGINFIVNLLVWVVVGLLILTNLGVQVSAVIAGLGVGGIAAALALQTILGDVFAGLSMYFDRPFDIGDFVIIEPHLGTVTRIGLRTTRIRSLWGEELVIPNGDLVKVRIKNYARMSERRVQFNFMIEYGQPLEKVALTSRITREAVAEQERVRFDRAHFKGFSSLGLEFEVIYYVLSPDYNIYMDIQQAINLAIYERLTEAGVRFAFQAAHLQERALDQRLPGGGDGESAAAEG